MALICIKHRAEFEIDPTDPRPKPVPRCLACVAEARTRVEVEKVRYAVGRYGVKTQTSKET